MPTPAPSTIPMFPSPISFDQQDTAINFEGINSNLHDGFSDPTLPPPYTRNNSISSTVSHSSMDASLETHRMLSNVLYGLRLEYGKQWSNPESEIPRRDGVFRSVSLLCDIVSEVLTDREGVAGTMNEMDSETNITFMLTLTAVSMILNIYKSICQMYSGCSEIMDLGKNPLHIEKMTMSLAAPGTNSSITLDNVMQLTTMDFHLARLGRIFCIPNKPSSFHTTLIGSGEGCEQIQELRTIVQRLIERFKTV